ncbi:hypothetical protein C1637_03705 [Chryseobacterium lactis]|uniref:Endonuclease GajA/Old nuclease/RecF-like AAA domain-containing protein n=1 Tax=Chryseobacterium lactis TaxID=1241981 RepID=A0A3G6RYN2_CHRLC|nr:AAA family ATPase [Chryseobacterium lactis]AZA81692.1 hypothetical protein EG342_07100 [Chryseobacterium lactis]AZB06690.1 hypothetical protein EG341_23220 [Chryseobacterium lactis]PNW15541.1 hypothetical protein C1637_03705 [Chryseobacterium lactis]
MEKLIIKNFGPIADIEIELNKYVILIGDTSTGKSVIAKLSVIFNEVAFKGIKTISNFKEHLKKFNISYLKKESYIKYSIGDDYIEINDNKIKNNNFKGLQLNEKKLHNLQQKYNNLLKDSIVINDSDLSKQISDLKLSFEELKETFIDLQSLVHYNLPLYIPTERITFSMAGNSLAGLWANNINISQSYKDFAAIYDKAKEAIKSLKYDSLSFDYHYNDENEHIVHNNKKIDLNQASSGIQSVLPLLLVLNYILIQSNKETFIKCIVIEEPEISLFPVRQKELIEYIVNLFNKSKARIVIPTHSPYILSAFNNLILAKNAYNENTKRKEEINKIINEGLWIDYKQISVYEIKDGKSITLNDDELKNINISAIDSASDILSEQADQLIDIRYEG